MTGNIYCKPTANTIPNREVFHLNLEMKQDWLLPVFFNITYGFLSSILKKVNRYKGITIRKEKT